MGQITADFSLQQGFISRPHAWCLCLASANLAHALPLVSRQDNGQPRGTLRLLASDHSNGSPRIPPTYIQYILYLALYGGFSSWISQQIDVTVPDVNSTPKLHHVGETAFAAESHMGASLLGAG